MFIMDNENSESFNTIKIIRQYEASDVQSNNNAPSYKYDILYENQRGLFVMGIPKFNSKVLSPADPPPWTNIDQECSPMDIHTFQLPDPSWEWVYKEWLIDMSGDVDEEGWEYAFDFHCDNWHGCYRTFRSFVRKRRWVKLRRLKGSSNEDIPPIPSRVKKDN
ncbi:hypothetical protein Glove_124g12 [Diversispora epigaea]|uniref:Peroxin/Ferlin domain-containing protein n=1 Tax=Diversispora epigaea TaxID=1348612 RepID=A0A397J7T8_9GLOM|nr:hypothetical protein Glove_124g12 [Diversispora epigaea]